MQVREFEDRTLPILLVLLKDWFLSEQNAFKRSKILFLLFLNNSFTKIENNFVKIVEFEMKVTTVHFGLYLDKMLPVKVVTPYKGRR